jgi:small-conductance mechanosensitive channel
VDKIFEFFGRVAFTLGGQDVTYGDLLFIPTLVIIGFLLTNGISRLIASRLNARKVGPDLIHLIRRIFHIVAIAVIVITTLDFIKVPLTAFAFISGAVAIGIGFGAQNIVNNFISGWILMWERPIRIGDFLEVGEDKGKVEAINTRSTRIRRVDGVHMLIPNSALLENTVVNWTLVDQLTRTTVRVGVAYGSPVKRVMELMLKATADQPEVLADPEPVIIFEDFGDNALIFDSFFWIQAPVDRNLRVVRSNIRIRIEELFRADGIEIAFPQRDVHLDGSITVSGADAAVSPG